MAAASAVFISFALVVTPIPEAVGAPAGPPIVSQVAVSLRHATLQLEPGRNLSAISALSPAQVLDIGQALNASAVTPTIASSPPLIALADLIDAAYVFFEPWVHYAVDVGAYVAAWIIPYVGWIVINQVDVVYNFVESLINSGVFNTTDWLRGEGSARKNIADWIVDLGLATVWLGIDEIDSWIPLPPLPIYPPRPPYADVPDGSFRDVLAYFLGLLTPGAATLRQATATQSSVAAPVDAGTDVEPSTKADSADTTKSDDNARGRPHREPAATDTDIDTAPGKNGQPPSRTSPKKTQKSSVANEANGKTSADRQKPAHTPRVDKKGSDRKAGPHDRDE